MASKKVTVVGAGFVGRTTAMRIVQSGKADVCLVDIIEGWPQGLALDIRHSAGIEQFEANIIGTNDYADTAGSDVVVMTAGLPRGPGMSRMDLLGKNAEIVSAVAGTIVATSPGAVVIVVTNPLDEMTFLMAQRSGFARERVMGMAGVLDSARLVAYIAEELKVSPQQVKAMTLGSHGEQMVPLPRLATVGGQPLAELVDEATLKRLFDRTSKAGSEVVNLLKKGSAFYAPSAAVAQMVEQILTGGTATLPVCAWLTGQYGVNDTYLGVPVRLGPGGVEEIVELELDDVELVALRAAGQAIKSRCEDLAKL
ncbi:MAG: malate dehydrogenase [Actinomycetota bacterium]